MDGNKAGDVCVRTVSESSVSVGGKDENTTQDLVGESLKRKEKVDDGGCGDCNGGEDIMVEVLGAEVLVDGICSGSGEGRSSGDVGQEGLDGVEPDMGSDGKLVKDGTPGSEGVGNAVEGGKENVLDSGQRESLEKGEVAGGELEMESGGKSVGSCEPGVEGVGCEKENRREDVHEAGSEEAVDRGEVANTVVSGEGEKLENEAEVGVDGSHVEAMLSESMTKVEKRGEVAVGDCATCTAPEEGKNLNNEAEAMVIESHLETKLVMLEAKTEEGKPVEVKVSPVAGISEGELVEEINMLDTTEGPLLGKGAENSGLVDALGIDSLKSKSEGLSEMIVEKGEVAICGVAYTTHLEAGGSSQLEAENRVSESHMGTVLESKIVEGHPCDAMESGDVAVDDCTKCTASKECGSLENEAGFGVSESHLDTTAAELESNIEEGKPVEVKVSPVGQGGVSERKLIEEITEMDTAEGSVVGKGVDDSSLVGATAIESSKLNPEGLSEMIVDQGGPIVDHTEDRVKENDQRDDVPGKEVTDGEVLHSSVTLENSVVSVEVDKNPEDCLRVNDVSQKVTVSSGGERLSIAETGEAIVAKKEDLPCSENVIMQNDSSEETSCSSAEEHQAAIEAENKITEDRDRVPTDPNSMCPSTHQVLPGGKDATVSSDAVQDQQLIPDKCLDSNTDQNHGQVDSKIGQLMEIDPDVTNIEKNNKDGNEEWANEGQLKDESASRKTDNGAVSIHSCQSNLEVTGGMDPGQMDLAVLDENVETSNLADVRVTKDHDTIPTDSNSLCPLTHEVLPDKNDAVVSHNAVQDQELIPDECLNGSRGHDGTQVDSNARQEVEIDHEVTDVEEGSSRGHNPGKVDPTGQPVEIVHEVPDVEMENADGEKRKANEEQVKDESASGWTGRGAVSVPSCQDNLEITGDGNVEQVCDAVLDQNVDNSRLDRNLSCTANDETLAPVVVCDNDQNSPTNDQGGKDLDGNEEVKGHVDAVGIEGNKEEANEEQVKDGSASGKTDDGAVSTPSGLVNPEFSGDGNAELMGEAVSDQNNEGSKMANMDAIPSCIENDKTLAPVVVCDNIKDPIADDQRDKAVDDNNAVMEHNADAMRVDVTNSDDNIGMEIGQDGSSNLDKQVGEQAPDADVDKAVDDSAAVMERNADAIRVDVTNSDENIGTGIGQDGSSNLDKQFEEQAPNADVDLASSHEADEMETEDHSTDTEVRRSARQVALRKGSMPTVTYVLPPEKEGEFSVSDLVWGKIRSHPWWPGQIFDSSDASEKANKYHKKDSLLVAYFGDRSFAWNDVSQLKPFCAYFSQEEKQSNSESFNNAVSCALEEVGRRVELGLACSCIPKDDYERIKLQIVENAGIRQESSKRESVDESAGAKRFEPHRLVEYMKAVAQFPKGIHSRLEFVIAKAQLSGFYRRKGYQLPEFQFSVGLLESDAEITDIEDKKHVNDANHLDTPFCDDGEGKSSSQENLKTQKRSSLKRKHNLKDGVYSRKKVRSMMDLMGEATELAEDDTDLDSKDSNKVVSPSSRKKRKSFDSFAEDPESVDRRKSISVAKVITTTQVPKPSFKIGERLRKVANQMTGAHALEINGEKSESNENAGVDDPVNSFQITEDTERSRMAFDAEYSSLNDLLSQLLLAAQDPKTKYSFLNVGVCFFSDFRNYVVPGLDSASERNGKRKRSHVGGPSETFEFDDMNDSYWTDRVIENGTEEQSSEGGTVVENQLVPVNPEKPRKVGRRPYSRKRQSNTIQESSEEKPIEYIDENAPAELVMVFPQLSPIPPETVLNRMFKRFGPLKESETEIDREGSRARVVFKKGSDAQVAYSSAGKFNIFGSVLVSYQLSHTISTPFRSSPVLMIEGKEDALNVISGGHEVPMDFIAEGHEVPMDFIAEGHEVPMDVMTEGQEAPMNVVSEDHEVTTGVMNEGHDEVPLDAEIG